MQRFGTNFCQEAHPCKTFCRFQESTKALPGRKGGKRDRLYLMAVQACLM